MIKLGNARLWLVPVLFAGVVGSAPAPASAANVTASSAINPLEKAVRQGARLFASDSFGGKRIINGQAATCNACHSNGGKTEGTLPNGAHIPSLVGAAAQFPKLARTGKVITLEQQVAHCVRGGLAGKPPASDSPQMVDLIAYLTSLSKGSPMGEQFK